MHPFTTPRAPRPVPALRAGSFALLLALAGCDAAPTEVPHPSASPDAGLATATTDEAGSPAAANPITRVVAASGRAYVVPAEGLAVGSVAYIDRTSTYQSVPAQLAGQPFIRTADHDRGIANTPRLLTLQLAREATVFVAYDSTTLFPEWLAAGGFARSGEQLTVRSNGEIRTYTLWSRTFAAGEVVLGSNRPGDSAGLMYTVIVRPTPPPVAVTAPYSARTPHWPHIRTMITDFRYPAAGAADAERNWTAAHYDWILGSGATYKPRNPTVKALTYTIYHTVMIPGRQGSTDNQASGYYKDMEAWFKTRPSCSLERAFLHTAEPRTLQTRKVMRVWSSDRWSLNLADACAREYTASRIVRQLGNAQSDMPFIDEHGSIWRYASGTVEYASGSAAYWADDVRTIQAIRAAIGGRAVMLNSAQYANDNVLRSVAAAGAAHLEMTNNPMQNMQPMWDWYDRVIDAGAVAQILSPWSDADLARHGAAGGIFPGGAARARL
jgi:hypothetical protein